MRMKIYILNGSIIIRITVGITKYVAIFVIMLIFVWFILIKINMILFNTYKIKTCV